MLVREQATRKWGYNNRKLFQIASLWGQQRHSVSRHGVKGDLFKTSFPQVCRWECLVETGSWWCRMYQNAVQNNFAKIPHRQLYILKWTLLVATKIIFHLHSIPYNILPGLHAEGEEAGFTRTVWDCSRNTNLLQCSMMRNWKWNMPGLLRFHNVNLTFES